MRGINVAGAVGLVECFLLALRCRCDVNVRGRFNLSSLLRERVRLTLVADPALKNLCRGMRVSAAVGQRWVFHSNASRSRHYAAAAWMVTRKS